MSSMRAQRVPLQCGLKAPALPTGAERARPLGTPDTSSVSFSQTVAYNAALMTSM